MVESVAIGPIWHVLFWLHGSRMRFLYGFFISVSNADATSHIKFTVYSSFESVQLRHGY